MASSFQSKEIKRLKSEGWLVLKTIRLNESGFPDIFAFKNGVTMFEETKQGSDTLKPLQKLRIDQLIAQGFDAKCVHETKGQIYPPLP